MKLLFTILSLLVLTKECDQKKEATTASTEASTSVENAPSSERFQSNDMTITYETQSRGFYDKVSITQDSIKSTKDRSLKNVTSRACAKDAWDDLMKSVKEISLPYLSEVEVPSKAHQYDGAKMATLKIMVDDVIYTTPVFDHGNPPESIRNLVNKVLALDGRTKKQ